MPDIDWMMNATYYDPAAGGEYVMTLGTIAEEFGNLTPNQSVRAHATTHVPIDLGDGDGLRRELTDVDLARLSHRHDRHLKGLSD